MTDYQAMGILEGIRGATGRNSWPPHSMKSRWELLDGYAALREANPAYVRAMASAQGMGGASNSYIVTPWPRRLSLTAAHMILGEPARILAPNPNDQNRVAELVALNDFNARARAAAYISSSEGGVYGKVSCSPNTPKSRKAPTIQFVSERRVIPRFANVDELVAATIVEEWDGKGSTVYRLLEHHEPGVIRYELYQGSNSEIGSKVPLSSEERTMDLPDEQATGIDDALLVTYIPNDRSVDSPYGISDYRGLETLFLALNEVATSSQDQQRLLRKRLIMDESLQTSGEFVDEEVLWVNQRHTQDGSTPILQPTPGDWKAGEHVAWQNSLLDLTLTLAGISPQSLGRDLDGGSASGIALKLKMAHTNSVMKAKGDHFSAGIAELFSLAARLDAMTVGTGQNIKQAYAWADTQGPFSVELDDTGFTDQTETADVVSKSVASGVMSKRTAIAELHPDWEEDQINEELARIEQEDAKAQASIDNAATQAVASLPPIELPKLNA